jgi:hypothetical protein
MSDEAPRGVVFPAAEDGSQSTSRLGRAVAADALKRVDPVGSLAAERETNWRSGYVTHLRRLVEAGLLSRDSALTVARDGLASLTSRMRVVGPDGAETGLTQLFDRTPTTELHTATVTGTAERDRELSLPYRGERLRGDALLRRLDDWVERGVIEPSCAEAVRTVAASPEWLSLDGQQVAVLGAGAEMGPLRSLLRWGADVVAVDLPRPAVWGRVLDVARGAAGRLSVPVPAGSGGGGDVAQRAGADLLHALPEVAAWLEGFAGPMVLGNYVYADGATNLRVSTAVDALSTHLLNRRPDLALAFLATPTDVFAVPAEVVEHSVRAYAGRSTRAKVLGRPLRMLSGGRLLQRNYTPGTDPGLNDSLVPQQGPNYALAKRLQRWRATVARDAGTTVSFHVAPPTRTRSVVKNRALAAAYAGSHRFGVEVFEPATSNTLMAALLVHDLRAGVPAQAHPWQDEAYAAAHGGLWRAPYASRSALGLAALLGLGSARG